MWQHLAQPGRPSLRPAFRRTEEDDDKIPRSRPTRDFVLEASQSELESFLLSPLILAEDLGLESAPGVGRASRGRASRVIAIVGAGGRKERDRNGLSHGGVAHWRGMKMIARIERRQQSFGMLRISGNLVEIDYCIEMAGSPDPLIDGFPI